MHELTHLSVDTTPTSSNLEELKKLSKQLVETESTLSAFWHLTPSLKCILRDGRFVKVNPSWTRVLGYTTEELLGISYKELIHVDDRQRTSDVEAALASNSYIFSFRNRFKHKFENRWVVIEWSANQEGDTIFAAGTDKTLEVEQELKVKKLIEEAVVLKNAIEHSNNGIVITDPNQPDNPVIYVNSTFEKITGFSKADILGQNCRMLSLAPTSLADLAEKERLSHAIKTQIPFKGYIRNARKDGVIFINDLKVSPVFDEHNKLCNYIGSISDCTDEYRQADIMKTVLTNAPFGIFLTNSDGDCIYVNDKWQELAGLDFQEAQGHGWRTALCDEFKDSVSAAWYAYTKEAQHNKTLTFNLESCFHNRKTDIITKVRIHAYFYNLDTTIGYIDIQPI